MSIIAAILIWYIIGVFFTILIDRFVVKVSKGYYGCSIDKGDLVFLGIFGLFMVIAYAWIVLHWYFLKNVNWDWMKEKVTEEDDEL